MTTKRKRRKTETSKVLLIVSDILVGIITIVSILSVFLLRDTGPLQVLIPSAFSLAGVSHGFYYWKAKAENLHKFGRDKEITEDDDNTFC